MKDRTNAPADRTRQPVQPTPGAPGVTVIPGVSPFPVRETVPEDLNPGADGFQGTRTPGPFPR
jgi:hypothetical protein